MDILNRITEFRQERGWTEYQLAEKSGLTQSTISSWYRKDMLPTIPSLTKICRAFDISLSYFFLEEADALVSLTDNQKEIIDCISKLTPAQQELLFNFQISLKKNGSRNLVSAAVFLLHFHYLPLKIKPINLINVYVTSAAAMIVSISTIFFNTGSGTAAEGMLFIDQQLDRKDLKLQHIVEFFITLTQRKCNVALYFLRNSSIHSGVTRRRIPYADSRSTTPRSFCFI